MDDGVCSYPSSFTHSPMTSDTQSHTHSTTDDDGPASGLDPSPPAAASTLLSLKPPQAPIATSSPSSQSRWSKVGQWVRGRDPTMSIDLDVNPEVLGALREGWGKEWRNSIGGTVDPATHAAEGISREEIRERVNRLESEFTRITETVAAAKPSKHQKDFELRAGLRVVAEVIEECRPWLMSIRSTLQAEPNNSNETQAVADLIHIERMYHFILFCYSKTEALKWVANPSAVDSHVELESDEPATPHRPNFFHSEEVGIGRTFGRQPNQALPLVTVVSSSQSHQQNLTTLIAVAFFGASITWSIIFSGTRGNLLVITWSASLFIVSTVAAFAATLLVLPEEDLVAKHQTVRWAVRILSLISMVHVLAGMLFLALSIFLLDPNHGAQFEGSMSRVWFQVAGGYAMGMGGVTLMVAGLVWRRYTVRTWFPTWGNITQWWRVVAMSGSID
ncbi:hypothetical protein FB45DRAFT_941218 [Roridomyces roridus]|uniref:Uncharacterized protein n=1 Tax=Roridomyces roridus TaxID=1738132 RepID=A0AAD7B626_9AGAR|nr:hypothetical protein FB45DRAFT_941218 [Roridomyces roridus]